MQFIQSVSTESEPEGKRKNGPRQPRCIDPGGDSSTNRNIREMPYRVRQMKKRYEVAEAIPRASVKRGP